MKQFTSLFWRKTKVGFKRGVATGVATLFRSKSYPLFGIATGRSQHHDETQVITAGGWRKTTPPHSIHSKMQWQFNEYVTISEPDGALFSVRNGLATGCGDVLTHDGKVVTENSDKGPLFSFSSRRCFPHIQQINLPFAQLAHEWDGAFFHWMFEVLPRIHLVENECDRFFISTKTPFQRESLELLGIPHSKIIPSQNGSARGPRVIVSSTPHHGAPWACDFLKERILHKLSKKAERRLYISRSDATRRRILNETELCSLLSKYGFEKATLSHLPLKEQMEIFYSASAIVAPHGAGLSHFLFCPPQTPVLEIFSPHYVHTCYWKIAQTANLRYHYLLGEGDVPADYVHPTTDPDIIVSLDKIEASLKLMSIQTR